MLHMTATESRRAGSYVWFCRCGAQAGGFGDTRAARCDGDTHLAESRMLERTTNREGGE